MRSDPLKEPVEVMGRGSEGWADEESPTGTNLFLMKQHRGSGG